MSESSNRLPAWSSEPFRAFFPLGIVASMVGALVWPLFYAGWWHAVPQLLHPRMMIFGFGAAFVGGFLGTAWPRFVEAEPMKRPELGLLLLSWTTAQMGYLAEQWRFGDAAFAVHATLLLAFLIHRTCSGGDRPNAAMLMAGGGVALGLTVSVTWTFAYFDLAPWAHSLTRLLAYQGMLLLPLLGVGTFMFPRFFSDPKPAPTAGLGLALTAPLILVSFVIEAVGWVRCGSLIRFAAIVLWAIIATPTMWHGSSPSTRAWALRLALGTIALSFLSRGIWPGPAYAIEHLLFLGGFALAMLLVADRVTLGHSDALPPADEQSKRWRWLVWLLVIAASTRVSADLKASLLVSHHIYAALMWVGVAAAWAIPHLRRWVQNPQP